MTNYKNKGVTSLITMTKVYLYNTMSKEKEEFHPIKEGEVGLYTCGPTVYSRAHVGNMRAFIFEDILKRVLLLNDYKIKHVMNITDVGHLTSDSDSGDDKMEKSAKSENITVWDIAQKYTDYFMNDIKNLNIKSDDVIWCKATDYIKEQIELVKTLEEKGYTYRTEDGIYFDTSKLDDYGKLARLNIEGLKAGARVDIGDKKNPTDFALWKFSPKADSGEKRQMEWESPWGVGFPGWHVECSAMSMKFLGETFDIHCGGIDHIQVHHSNEIAQSEAATGKPFVNYWMHNEFLVNQEGKMSKSKGNISDLDSLAQFDVTPLGYRYFCLNTHYKKQLMFSVDALKSAQDTLDRLKRKTSEIKEHYELPGLHGDEYLDDFKIAVSDDLNTPRALGIMWDMINDESVANESKLQKLEIFDSVLGLDLLKFEEKNEAKTESGKVIEYPTDCPDIVIDLAKDRDTAKLNKDWVRADTLRDEIKKLGFEVKDKAEKIILEKI